MASIALVHVQMAMPFDHGLQLSVGAVIRVFGIVSHDPYRFSIGLIASGHNDDSHNALLFTVRFDGNLIVMNSRQHGTWGKEERLCNFPFVKGDSFVMIVRVQDCGYEAIVNGQRVHMYKHRIPLEHVQRLFISDQPKGNCQSLCLADVSVVDGSGQTQFPEPSSVSNLLLCSLSY